MTGPPRLIIGTYTEDLPHVSGQADGVLGAAYDPATGTIGAVTVLARCRNPSFAAIGADGTSVYVVNETASFAGQPGGGITAYARRPDTGALRELGARSSGGAAPCQLAIDPSGRALLVANYEGGSVLAASIELDGSLGPELGRVQHAGSGADPVRQTGPHPHMAAPDPVTGDILVADLGLDAVLTYRLTGTGLTERPGAQFAAPPGAGPRHLAFHPDGRHLFVVDELDSSVLTLRRTADHAADHADDHSGGRFELVGVTATVPPGDAGPSLAAGIRVTPSGRHVLVSNRGHDSIAMLSFDPAARARAAPLTLTHLEPAGGSGPRDLCLTRDGARLVAATTDSHRLTVLEIDETAGRLRLTGAAEAPSPASVLFAPR